MVQYTIYLKIKSSNEEYKYSLDLVPSQEDMPDRVFTLEIREALRKKLQDLTLCRINDIHLNQIIKTWLQDIKEGYRYSAITLNLPLMKEDNIDNLDEKGNQEMPDLWNPDLSGIEPRSGMLPPLTFY
jgi:hypothetical protein